MAGFRRTIDRNWATGALRGRLPRTNSTATRDPQRAFTSLLILPSGDNGSTTFTDLSPNAFAITVGGGAQVQDGGLRSTGKSILLDGSGDSLSVADAAALQINSGANFTVECSIKTTQDRQYATLLAKGNSVFSSGSWTLLINEASSTAGDVAVYNHAANSGLSVWLRSTGINIRDGNEHHIAWVRFGNAHYLIVDGAIVASAFAGYSSGSENAGPVIIGNDANFTPRDFNGNIWGIRITKGYARYIQPAPILDRPLPAG
jgi:hypothetical protein